MWVLFFIAFVILKKCQLGAEVNFASFSNLSALKDPKPEARLDQIEANLTEALQRITVLEKHIQKPVPKDIESLLALSVTELASYPDRKMYDAFIALLKNANYDKAAIGFSNFFEAFPQSALRSNSLYWRGTALLMESNYEAAIGVFDLFLSYWPKHEKSTDALFKKAICHYQLGRQEQACVALKLVSRALREDRKRSPEKLGALIRSTKDLKKRLHCEGVK